MQDNARSTSVTTLLGWASVFAFGIALLGSWVPFHLQNRPTSEVWNDFVASLDSQRHGRGDFTANVLLGVPLGFLLLGWLTVGRRSSFVVRFGWSLLAVVAVVGQAFICELGQGWIRHRVPSATDVFAQTLGGIGGVVAWWGAGKRFESAIGNVFGHESLLTRGEAVVTIAAVGTLIWTMLPMDFIVSPADIARKWTRGGIELVPFTRANPEGLGWLYQWVMSGVIGVPLGLWAGITLLPRIQNRRPSWYGKTLAAIIFGVLPEMMQVVIVGRVASATDALFAIVGVLLGIQVGQRVWDKRSNEDVEQLRFFSRPSFWYISAAVYWVAYCLAAWYPFEFVTDKDAVRSLLDQIVESPFSDYRGSNVRAIFVFIRLGMMSAVFGALLGAANAMVTSRVPRFLLGGLAVASVIGSAFLIELGQLLEVSHTGAGLGVTVRVLAGVLGMAGGFWICKSGKLELVPSGGG